MSQWTGHHDVEETILRPNITLQESQAFYSKWADTYDDMHVKGTLEYKGLEKFYEALENLFPNPKNLRVLDIGAGTGLTAQRLGDLGYTHIDALEPSPAMLKLLKKKNIYNNVFEEFIGGDEPLTIPDDSYDALVMCGVFAPGHIPCSAVPDMIRITKPGGYIVNCMREEYMWTVPEYQNRLEPLLEKCEKDGLWKKIKYERYPNHFSDKNGILMIYQVC